MVTEWDARRAADIVGLVVGAFPGERLDPDDVATCLFDDPDLGIVLATDDGSGVAAGVVRTVDGQSVAHVQVLAVAEEHRRQGHGRALLSALGRWAGDQGAPVLMAGAGAPFYLWPGIDHAWTPALCLFEAAGFTERRPAANMSFPDTYRADPPLGVEVRRVSDDREVGPLTELCAAHHPHWLAELGRGIESGTAFGAWEGGAARGFACHSVNRLGWVGPMATDPTHRSQGVGGALLSALTADLRPLQLGTVEVAWVGPVSFYAKAAGAEVSRVFRCVSRRLA